jgi:hypothetical protein
MAAFAKVESLHDVQAHEHDGLLTFTAVPIAVIDRFVRALTSAELPLPAPAPRANSAEKATK